MWLFCVPVSGKKDENSERERLKNKKREDRDMERKAGEPKRQGYNMGNPISCQLPRRSKHKCLFQKD